MRVELTPASQLPLKTRYPIATKASQLTQPTFLLGRDVVSLVDFWHAAEYLGAAARVLEIKRKARAGQSVAGGTL